MSKEPPVTPRNFWDHVVLLEKDFDDPLEQELELREWRDERLRALERSE